MSSDTIAGHDNSLRAGARRVVCCHRQCQSGEFFPFFGNHTQGVGVSVGHLLPGSNQSR